jgi:hypothetical protein
MLHQKNTEAGLAGSWSANENITLLIPGQGGGMQQVAVTLLARPVVYDLPFEGIKNFGQRVVTMGDATFTEEKIAIGVGFDLVMELGHVVSWGNNGRENTGIEVGHKFARAFNSEVKIAAIYLV